VSTPRYGEEVLFEKLYAGNTTSSCEVLKDTLKEVERFLLGLDEGKRKPTL